MPIKTIIKKTPLFDFLAYIRYLFSRYIKNFYYKSVILYFNNKLKSIDCESVNFFGYYNLSPQNKEGKIIYLRVSKELKRGCILESAEIMLEDQFNCKKQIGLTRAWNWQQGCMLQWLGPDFNKIIFNDYENGEYVSKVISNEENLLRIYSKPIYAVAKNGEFALTLSYERLTKIRPDYGYFNKPYDKLLPECEDGIWKLNLNNGQSDLIITLVDLKNLKFVNSMINAEHKVNHIDINSSSLRFMFLHRWVGPNGRFMRLITANIDGSDLYILNGDKMTSHCCWLNDHEIISFCFVEGIGNGYYKFLDKTNKVNLLSGELPKEDGHPSVSPKGNWLITDTYPNISCFSKLLLYDLVNNKKYELGMFYQPLKYNGEMRIDLHPKWSMDGKNIFFESGHSGRRQLNKLDISNIIN